MNARHDNQRWLDSDFQRSSMANAGEVMAVACCILFIQGDWAEYAKTMGFPNWQDLARPCFGCNAYGSMLQRIGGVSPMTLPGRSNDEDDYFESCRRCEVRVTVTADLHQVILNALHYDKRDQGSKGRALKHDVLIANPPLRHGGIGWSHRLNFQTSRTSIPSKRSHLMLSFGD